MRQIRFFSALFISIALLVSCNIFEQVSHNERKPELKFIENPTADRKNVAVPVGANPARCSEIKMGEPDLTYDEMMELELNDEKITGQGE